MDLFYDIAQRVGIAGAFLLLLALVAQYRGYWFSAATVDQLKHRIGDLQVELQRTRDEQTAEREEHRQEVAEWERRTFSALGVSETVARIAEESVARTSRVAPRQTVPRTSTEPTRGSRTPG